MPTIEEAVATASNVHGWMTEPELAWLAEQASKRKLVVEIGSWQGRSSKAMAMTAIGKLFCVDAWDMSCNVSRKKQKLPAPDGLFLKFKENLADEIASNKVQPVRMHSLDAAKEIMHLTGGKLLDMVFIDADHSYEAVVKDIAAWRNLVAVDGILCGHDYDISRHPGVVKAVDESIKFKVIPNTSIWVLNKK